jgi:hypothetical protein
VQAAQPFKEELDQLRARLDTSEAEHRRVLAERDREWEGRLREHRQHAAELLRTARTRANEAEAAVGGSVHRARTSRATSPLRMTDLAGAAVQRSRSREREKERTHRRDRERERERERERSRSRSRERAVESESDRGSVSDGGASVFSAGGSASEHGGEEHARRSRRAERHVERRLANAEETLERASEALLVQRAALARVARSPQEAAATAAAAVAAAAAAASGAPPTHAMDVLRQRVASARSPTSAMGTREFSAILEQSLEAASRLDAATQELLGVSAGSAGARRSRG